MSGHNGQRTCFQCETSLVQIHQAWFILDDVQPDFSFPPILMAKAVKATNISQYNISDTYIELERKVYEDILYTVHTDYNTKGHTR